MAAGSTYTPIATTTGTGSSATITFSSIPSTYTDLVLIATIFTAANDNQTIRVNGDTNTNYSTTALTGNGTSAASSRASNNTSIVTQSNIYANATEPVFSIVQFMNYANTSTYKTVLARSNRASQGTEAFVNLWRSTSAISSITIAGGSNFTTNATFTLYGIAAA